MVELPLKHRDNVGVLSVSEAIVTSRKSRSVAITSRWRRVATCSVSLLVMVPLGFSRVTSVPRVAGEKGERQTVGAEPSEK